MLTKFDRIESVRVRDVLKTAWLSNMMCSVFGYEIQRDNGSEEVNALKEDDIWLWLLEKKCRFS